MAAAASGRYGDPPPPLLVQAWDAKRWGLPEAGGTNDQPAGLLRKFGVLLNDYDAFRAYRQALTTYNNKALAEWESANGDIMDVIQTMAHDLERYVRG